MENAIEDFELRAKKAEKRYGYSQICQNTFIKVDRKKFASLDFTKKNTPSFMNSGIFK